MKIYWKIFVVTLTIIALGGLAGIFLWNKSNNKEEFSNNTSETVAGTTTIKNDDYTDRLAKSLSDKGMILYCSFNSEDCKAQKEMFGDSIQNLNFVECDAAGPDANPDECIGRGVSTYPTWIYQDEVIQGKLDLSELAKKIGFSE